MRAYFGWQRKRPKQQSNKTRRKENNRTACAYYTRVCVARMSTFIRRKTHGRKKCAFARIGNKCRHLSVQPSWNRWSKRTAKWNMRCLGGSKYTMCEFEIKLFEAPKLFESGLKFRIVFCLCDAERSSAQPASLFWCQAIIKYRSFPKFTLGPHSEGIPIFFLFENVLDWLQKFICTLRRPNNHYKRSRPVNSYYK